MFEVYQKLFEQYLKYSKSKYDSNNPYNNLEECCTTCERLRYELFGMLSLLEECGEITHDKYDEESENLNKTFNTHELFNAYINHDEIQVMCWVERK